MIAIKNVGRPFLLHESDYEGLTLSSSDRPMTFGG
jgi:hypothetical protein